MKFNNANAHYELNFVDKTVTWLLKPPTGISQSISSSFNFLHLFS